MQFKLTSVENWANTFPISAQQVLLWINDFAGGIIPTTELLALFNLTQDAASGKTNKFGYELWALTSPFSKLGGALEELSIDLADLTGGWDKTGAAGIAAHEKLTGVWGGVGEWFKTKVFDPLESGFQSTGNGILGTFGGVSSGATSAMNGLIKGINQVKFTIPSWVPLLGGKSYGFNIPLLQAPQIPKLATGAVLPANKPFLAVVGDQRHGTNVEAPLTTIQEAVRLDGWVNPITSLKTTLEPRDEPVSAEMQTSEEEYQEDDPLEEPPEEPEMTDRPQEEKRQHTHVEKVIVAASAGRLLQSLSKLIEGKYQEQEKKLRQTMDRKQRREIQEKKQAMGLKD